MPRVSVASPAANQSKRFETRARTWAELKPEIERLGLSLSGVEAVMRPGNVTLSRNEAELPTEDFKIFLVPTKNKAGNLDEEAEDLGRELAAVIARGARLAGVGRVRELKAKLIEEVENFFDVNFEGDYDLPDDSSHDPRETEDADVREARRMARD